MALPIAVQLYSVRDDVKEDLYGTLKKVKEMGYDGVEFAGLYGYAPADIKKWCDEIGLVPISAHVPFVDMLKNPVPVLSTYAEIGCKYVTLPYLMDEHRPGHPNFPYVIEFVRTIGKVAKSLGLILLYHNHDFEFRKIGDSDEYGLDILYKEISADLLQTELDTCWVHVGGEDPAAYIRKYTGRSPVVHLKDYYGEKSEDMYELIGSANIVLRRPEGFELRPVGSGIQNFPAILEAAKDAGTEWVVVEQDRPSMDLTPMECIEKSINYLKSFEW